MSTSWLSDAAAILALLLTPVLVLITGAFFWASSAAHTKTTEIELDYSPNNVSGLEMFRLIVLLLSKTLIPGYSVELCQGKEADTFNLPALRVSGKLSIDPSHVDTFNKAMTIEGSDIHINPFFLFTQVNPLVVFILAHPASPIKPLGSVNTRNEFKFVEPTTCSSLEELTSGARRGTLTYVAISGEKGIRRKRGIEFSIRITLTLDNRDILILKMWFMQFLASSVMPLSKEAQTHTSYHWDGDLLQNGRRHAPFHIKTAHPKLWARSCKDYNPIHISPMGAKLFGFKGVIAHGNHVVALAIQQQLADQNSRVHRVFTQSYPQVKLVMQFLRPMPLPLDAIPIWGESQAYLDIPLVICGRNNAEHIRGKIVGRSPQPRE